MRSTFLVVLCATFASTAASANNLGIFGKSGRDAESGTCTQCHLGDNGPAPTITVKGLDQGLHAGGFADILITVKTKDPTGGIAAANCPNRCAGFGAAVDTGAGSFVVPTGSPVQVNTTRDEAAHIAKSQFVNGEVTYHLVLTGLKQGQHTFWVAGNDVDGQVETGDRVANIVLPFTVGSATTTTPDTGDQPPAGCASIRGSSAPIVALIGVLGVLGFRRRRASR